MKTLAIRYWLAVALGIYFVCAVAPFVVVGTSVCSYEKPEPQAASIANLLGPNVARWADPAWQQQLAAQLPSSLSMVLLSGDYG